MEEQEFEKNDISKTEGSLNEQMDLSFVEKRADKKFVDSESVEVKIKIMMSIALLIIVAIVLFVVLFIVDRPTKTVSSLDSVTFSFDSNEDSSYFELEDALQTESESCLEESMVDSLEQSKMNENTILESEKRDEEAIREQEPTENTDNAKPEITPFVSSEEVQRLTFGIDVSKYQGIIDWTKVADAGVDFAIIRLGYRSSDTGEIHEDTTAKFNLQEATARGIQCGCYFFSTAITEAEAIEEAKWVLDFISTYPITYPVGYNCEGYSEQSSRQKDLTKEARTRIAKVFLDEIKSGGYTPMFYASKAEMENENDWFTSQLEGNYKIWISRYITGNATTLEQIDYDGICDIWQYTNNGTMEGISGNVDLNLANFGYDQSKAALVSKPQEQVSLGVENLMTFTDVSDNVTAKNKTNLRVSPSQESNVEIAYVLNNGEFVLRTGISDSGWSRLEWNGQIVYAVTSYLTTDTGNPSTENQQNSNNVDHSQLESSDADGIQTVFRVCSDKVTPKDRLNLRSIPSVTREDSVVIATIQAGEVIERTGINEDLGWSRVVYQGQTLYCVSSYLNTVAE